MIMGKELSDNGRGLRKINDTTTRKLNDNAEELKTN